MISGRALLLTLVGLNLVALLWWTGQLVPITGSPLEPQRLSRQIEPDRLRVVEPSPRSSAPADRAVAGHRELAVPDRQSGAARTGAPDGGAAQEIGAAVPVAASGPAADAGAIKGLGQPVTDVVAPRPPAGHAARAAADVGATAARDVASAPRDTPGPTPSRPDVPDASAPSTSAPRLAGPASAPSAATPPAGEPAPQADEPARLAMAVDHAAVPDGRPICLRAEGLTYFEFQRRAEQLREAGLQVGAERAADGRHVVYVGPFADVEAAELQAEALRAKGVADLAVLRWGPLQNAISLGLLATYDLAQRHREQLERRGVENLRVGPANTQGARYRLLASGPRAAVESVTQLFDTVSVSEGGCES